MIFKFSNCYWCFNVYDLYVLDLETDLQLLGWLNLGTYLQLQEWLNLGTYLQLLEWLNLGTYLQLWDLEIVCLCTFGVSGLVCWVSGLVVGCLDL